MARSQLSLSTFRPLAQAFPRPEGDVLVFETLDRDVRVEGDPRLVHELLAACDGRRTAEQIAHGFGDDVALDLGELIETLAENDVLVDSTQAYRRFNRESAVRSGLFRALPDEELEDLMRECFTPPRLLDRHEPIRPSASALLDLSANRGSAWPGRECSVSFAELSTVLASSYRIAETGRPVPSAGALYPLVLHLIIRQPLPPLDPGLWWYDPRAQELRQLREDEIELEPLLIPHPTTDPLVAAGTPLLVLSADLERMARKYSNRGYRYALMETGAAMQNAYLAAAELDLPVRAIGGFDDHEMHALLGLPPDVAPLLTVLLGS